MAHHKALQLLEALDGGNLLRDLNKGLGRVTRRVSETLGAGEVTVTLKITSAPSDSVEITPVLRSKVNDSGRREMRVWPERFGGFSDEDPRQGALISVDVLPGRSPKPVG